jgi:hypothetical protein
MVLAVLAVLAVGLGLILAKAVPVLAGIVLMVVGLVAVLAIGERRDRSRQRGVGHAMRRLDHRRAVIPTGMEAAPGDNLDAYADTLVSHQLSDQPRSRSGNAR